MKVLQDGAAGSETRTAKADAAEFLQGALVDGPVAAVELIHRAREHGLTAKVLRRGRESLALQVRRIGFGRGSRSVWALPRLEAQPIPSEEGGGASPEHTMSEARQPTVAGYEVIGVEPDAACEFCGERGDDPVYLMQARFKGQTLFKGGRREPMHVRCAAGWFEFCSALAARRGGQV